MIDGVVEIVETQYLREKENQQPKQEQVEEGVLVDALKINKFLIIKLLYFNKTSL